MVTVHKVYEEQMQNFLNLARLVTHINRDYQGAIVHNTVGKIE